MIQNTLGISIGKCYIKQAPDNLNQWTGKTGQEKKKKEDKFSLENSV